MKLGPYIFQLIFLFSFSSHSFAASLLLGENKSEREDKYLRLVQNAKKDTENSLILLGNFLKDLKEQELRQDIIPKLYEAIKSYYYDPNQSKWKPEDLLDPFWDNILSMKREEDLNPEGASEFINDFFLETFLLHVAFMKNVCSQEFEKTYLEQIRDALFAHSRITENKKLKNRIMSLYPIEENPRTKQRLEFFLNSTPHTE